MSDKKQTVIFLVRHGQTDQVYSQNQHVDGERILTEKGEKQITKVGEYLKSFAPSVIYSSPIKRTMQCSQMIKKIAEVSGNVVETKELLEVYDNERYLSLEEKLPRFLESVATKHPGEQIVCVSHQDVIEGALRGLSFESVELPCQVAEIFRIVYANNVPVECVKLKPADEV